MALSREGRLADDDSVDRLAHAFGLLSDPGRVRLLIELRAAGELYVGDLAAASGMGESATSHALRLLRAAGVVKARRVGRHVGYSLTDAHIRTLLDVALEHYRHGGSGRVAKLGERPPGPRKARRPENPVNSVGGESEGSGGVAKLGGRSPGRRSRISAEPGSSIDGDKNKGGAR